MNIKKELYDACLIFIENRLIIINATISEIRESLMSETKSSAGDKHETGRAMLQIEREKAGNQLAEIQKVKQTLLKIDVTKTTNIVGLGSIVYTTKNNYFISISAGEIKANNIAYYAVSPNTPISQLLLSKKSGDKILFRDQSFQITSVI
ncbi:MAG: 3-oxoacyl-ACP synthase [Flavobacteriaceae bacterium]